MPVRLGEDPYGFMDLDQAIPGDLGSRGIAAEVLTLALDMDAVRDEAIDTFILAVGRSDSYSRSDTLAECLPKISHLTASQEAELVRAFNDNAQVNTQIPWKEVIVGHLKRMTGNDYVFDEHQLPHARRLIGRLTLLYKAEA